MAGRAVVEPISSSSSRYWSTLSDSIRFVRLVTPAYAFNEIDDVIIDFINFIGSRPLVGYFLQFDISMINKYLKPKLGITLPNKILEVSAIYYDYKIERIPQANIDLRFNTIMNELKIPSFGKHDAYSDAMMTSMILIKLKNLQKVKLN